MVNQNMNGGSHLNKLNKIIAILMSVIAVVVIAIVIISFFKYKEVNYINSHIESIEVTSSTSDEKSNINSGKYQFVDYKPNGKELEIKQIDSNETYNIDLKDKHFELTGKNEIENGEVYIKAPSKKVDFNLFKSYKDKSKTKIMMNKDQLKEVSK